MDSAVKERIAILRTRQAYRDFLRAHSSEEINKSYELLLQMRTLERNLDYITSTLPKLSEEVSK